MHSKRDKYCTKRTGIQIPNLKFIVLNKTLFYTEFFVV